MTALKPSTLQQVRQTPSVRWSTVEKLAREHRVLGRSEGCFAVSQADLGQVLERLGPGRLIVATKL